jgi:hypothetical protein
VGLAAAAVLADVAFWQYWTARAEASNVRIAEEKATKEASNARTFEERARSEASHANTLRIASQAALRQGDQFDLGLLLSFEAYRAEVTYETFSTLFAGANANPRLIRFQHGHKGYVTGWRSAPTARPSLPRQGIIR